MKFYRRHLLRICTALVAALFIVSAAYGHDLDAETDRADQKNQEDEIRQYKSQLLIAGLALDSGRAKVANELLADTNPVLRDWEYGFLRGEILRAGQDGVGKKVSEGSAEDVSFSPDGKHLVFGRGNNVVVWDFVDDRSMELAGHQGSVATVAVSPDGKKIATGGWDGKIFVWDLASGEKVSEYRGHNPMNTRPGAHETQIVRDLCFSPNGQEIVSTAFVNSPFVTDVEPELKVWSVATGKTLNTLRGDHNLGRSFAIISVAYSPQGNLIATGGFDNKVRIWNASTGNAVHTIEGHQNNVLSVTFSPDGKRLATASTDRTLAIWDVSSGEELTRLKGHRSPVFSVQFSQSGKRIVSGCYDHSVKIWHAETGIELLSLRQPGAMIRSVAMSQDDQWIAAGRNGTSKRPGVSVWQSTDASRNQE